MLLTRAWRRSRRPLRRRGVSACASSWRERGDDGVLLEAAVCFAAVKSHTGNVGKHIQADASAGDDSSPEVTQSRRRREKNTARHTGDFMLSTS